MLNLNYVILKKNNKRLKIHYFCYISNDQKQNSFFVWYHFSYHWSYMSSIDLLLTQYTI